MPLHPPYAFPQWLAPLMPRVITRMPAKNKKLYLSFDDGPDPEVTPYVLDVLKDYDAHATFFLIGDRIQGRHRLLQRMVREGHRLGNHTFHHLNAWKTPCRDYLQSIDRTAELIRQFQEQPPPLFRPPYGRLTPRCLRRIPGEYRIVLWSYLSLDYDRRINPEKSLDLLKQKLAPGHILVFHDSRKAFPSLRRILPPLLDHFTRRGFDFDKLF